MKKLCVVVALVMATTVLNGQSSRRSQAQAVSFETMTISSSAVAFSPATLGAVAIATSSVANPTVITTSASHFVDVGQSVVIAGHSGSTPAINGTHTVLSVLSATTFTIAVNVTVGGTGGTVLGPEPGGQIHPSYCEGVVEGGAIRYRADSSAPTAAIGVPLAVSSRLEPAGYKVLLGLRFIRQTVDATIYWQCYRE